MALRFFLIKSHAFSSLRLSWIFFSARLRSLPQTSCPSCHSPQTTWFEVFINNQHWVVWSHVWTRADHLASLTRAGINPFRREARNFWESFYACFHLMERAVDLSRNIRVGRQWRKLNRKWIGGCGSASRYSLTTHVTDHKWCRQVRTQKLRGCQE